MRLVAVAAVALLVSGPCAFAQNTVRYFTGVPNLLEDLDTDVILKETRAGSEDRLRRDRRLPPADPEFAACAIASW